MTECCRILPWSLQQYSDCLWRTSHDRNSTNQRRSPWLATGEYEMPKSVHSIDGERLHHRVSHWVYRPMGMRGHVSVCPLRIKNAPFLWTVYVVPWTPQVGISIISPDFVWSTNKSLTDRPRYLFCSNSACDAAEKRYHIAANTFCQGANSKSKLSVYCRYLSGRLWWGDVFRLESSSLRPRCSYIVAVTFFNNNFVNGKATCTLIRRLKIYEIKYNISLNDVHT